MTPENARVSANILLAVAAGAVAFAILRHPEWRRLAARLIRAGLANSLPHLVADETRRAWAASGHGP